MFLIEILKKPFGFISAAPNNPASPSLVGSIVFGDDVVDIGNQQSESQIRGNGTAIPDSGDLEAVNEHDTLQSVRGPGTVAIQESSSSSIRRVKGKRGLITLLDNAISTGVIDNEFEFQKSNWIDLNLKRGQTVLYSAFYETDSAKWLVTSIKPVLSEEQLVVNERSKYRTLYCRVKKVDSDTKDAIVSPKKKYNDNIEDLVSLRIAKDMLPNDYPVEIGDWLTIKLEANGHGNQTEDSDDSDSECVVDDSISSAKLISVDWTEQKTSVGRVEQYKKQLCIDGIIHFTIEEVAGRRKLNINDEVEVVSVSSDQDFGNSADESFPKRALAVKFLRTRSSNQNNNQLALGEEWEEEDLPSIIRDREFNDLFSEKKGVRIIPSKYISFQKVKIGETAETSVTIQNKGNDPVTLMKVDSDASQDVCEFTLKFNEGNHSSNQTPGSADNNKSTIITLFPGVPFSFKVSCSPIQFGKTKELYIFDFGDFKIARYLTVTALPNTQNDGLESYSSLANNSSGKRNLTEYWNLTNREFSLAAQRKDTSNMTSVRGPTAVRAPFFIANKIPSNYVPSSFRSSSILRKEDIRACQDLHNKYPNVNWNGLDAANYTVRFHVALWFEEMENDDARRDCDLYNVVMEPYGNSELMFRVPGLKEMHPPVLVNDPVKCFGSTNDYKNSGYISKLVFPDDDTPMCFVKFDESFSRSYSSTRHPVTIEFGLGRTPFKRAHFAVDQAMKELGPDWLFPRIVTMKTPRIQFVEDPKDNLQLLVTNKDLIAKNKAIRKRETLGANASTSESRSQNSVFSRRNDIRGQSIYSFESKVELPLDLPNVKLRWYNHMLNEEQRNAVRRILKGQGRPLPYIIFGPPGTGKTVTVVEAILQIYFMEKTSRILVTVPSNAGADLITEHLIATNRFVPGDLVRLNGFIRSDISLTDSIMDFCVDGENLESVVKHRLIISTVTTAGQFFQLHLNTGHFSHVFVDEAGYCTEPEALISAVLTAVNKEGQLILAGDPKQLGPVLLCDISVNEILDKSLMERLMETPVYARDETSSTKYNASVLTKLVKCYRSHDILLKLPSQKFYCNELISVAKYEDAYELSHKLDFLPRKGVPLIFHGVRGVCSKDDSRGRSCFNLSEVCQILYYVQTLKNNGVESCDIGIITPYRKQVEKIRKGLQLHLLENEIPKVASVQEFQGGEKKVIIISTVRTEYKDTDWTKKLIREKSYEFLCYEKRFNVAVTRAKGLMIIIGDPHLLYNLPNWKDYLQYAVDLGAYVGCDKPRQLESRKSRKSDRLQDFLKNLPSSSDSASTSSSSFSDSDSVPPVDSASDRDKKFVHNGEHD